MDTGEEYYAPYPGKFRFMFCVEESTLREGITRSAFCPSNGSVQREFILTVRVQDVSGLVEMINRKVFPERRL